MELNAKTVMNRLQNKTNFVRPIDDCALARLKSVMTVMLKDLVEMSLECNISFMLAYGSVLGAVRHGGFIPWDDDLDICMSRTEWNKFKELFEQKLGGKYELEAPDFKGHNAKATFAKMYLKDTKLIDIYDVNTPYINGIYIDIFVLDYVSNNKLIRSFDNKFAQLLKFCINSQVYYQYPNPLIKQMMNAQFGTRWYLRMRKCIGFFMSVRSHNWWCAFFDKFFSRHKDGRFLSCFSDRNDIRPLDIYYPCRIMSFNNIDVNVPGKTEEYLLKQYGEKYMELPPVEDRETHMIVDLNFGQY